MKLIILKNKLKKVQLLEGPHISVQLNLSHPNSAPHSLPKYTKTYGMRERERFANGDIQRHRVKYVLPFLRIQFYSPFPS